MNLQDNLGEGFYLVTRNKTRYTLHGPSGFTTTMLSGEYSNVKTRANTLKAQWLAARAKREGKST